MVSLTDELLEVLKQRIMIFDGAMGTMIQKYRFEEADFRGTEFKNHPCDLIGNNDMLSITRPNIIYDIHKVSQYETWHSGIIALYCNDTLQ